VAPQPRVDRPDHAQEPVRNTIPAVGSGETTTSPAKAAATTTNLFDRHDSPTAGRAVTSPENYLGERDADPIFITKTGRRMDEPAAWRLIRRLARQTAITSADRLNPHSLRHSFVTAALDAGVSLRDVQDAAGHADPRTARRYDRARHNLDRHATYAVTAFLAGDDASDRPPSG
jgi:short subunit dehydrogenase-like uncharacterized protein